jgi:hypothetical protein
MRDLLTAAAFGAGLGVIALVVGAGLGVIALVVGAGVLPLVRMHRAGMVAGPDQYRFVLTEDGYTTADGPMTFAEAQRLFDQFARCVSPHGGSRMRVMTETEYQRTAAKEA